MIEFKEVTKSYSVGTKALRGVSMQIEDGDFVFLVGPSGSGKSTIIKLITGELRPTTGIVNVNGYSVSRIRKRDTDSTVPYGDSFTTALSVVALYMLARKQAEQWLVWLVVDAVSCGLYLYKGLYPTAALYGLYTILAWVGYLRWLKMIEEDATLPTA